MRIISSFTDLYDHASGWVDPTITFVRETEMYPISRNRDSSLTRIFNEFTRRDKPCDVYFILGKVFQVVNGEVYHKNNLPAIKEKCGDWWIFNSNKKYQDDYIWINERFDAPIIGVHVPEWRWHRVDVEINPMIKDTGIGKHYPPFNMQQDIMQWIINRQEPKGDYDFDDETVRNSKGFDNRSFKHRK